MTDPVAQTRAAKDMVLRILLSDLYVAVCMSADDPIAEVERRSKLNLNALDQIVDENGKNEMLNHAALHEMETFWRGVAYEVRERVKLGLDRPPAMRAP